MAKAKAAVKEKTEEAKTAEAREPQPVYVYPFTIEGAVRSTGGPEWFLKTLRKMKNVTLFECVVGTGQDTGEKE